MTSLTCESESNKQNSGISVQYKHYLWSWRNYDSYIEGLIKRPHMHRILEVGAGANPTLSIECVRKYNLEYTILDISAEELAKAPDDYPKIHADIASCQFDVRGGYDLVFSRMLAEHVQDGRVFHQNIAKLLAKDGIAFHWFPTLYNIPLVMNLLLPERLTEGVLRRFSVADRSHEGNYGKFPAHYSWCRGPMTSQIKRLESLGYSVEEYIGFFGHGYYQKIKPLHAVDEWLAAFLIKKPLPVFTSSAFVVLKR